MPVPVRIHTTPGQKGGCGWSGEMMRVTVLRPEAEPAPHHKTIAPTQLALQSTPKACSFFIMIVPRAGATPGRSLPSTHPSKRYRWYR